jgi:hypothetical protein
MSHPAVAGGVLFACLTLVHAQEPNPLEPPRDAPAAQDVMLTGCVVESSDAGTFVLNNAVSRPENKELPKMYRLVPTKKEMNFTAHLNHQVHTTGSAEVTTSPDPVPGERLEPRELPALTVQTIQSVSERCLQPAR